MDRAMDRAALHDEDVYAWSREQAALLRRLAETRSDLSNALDLSHVAEEIEDVGRSEAHRVERFLELLLQHILKLASSPESPPARHWSKEIELQSAALRHDYRRSMQQLIDLERIWQVAKARADAALDDHAEALLGPLPERCPFSLDGLVAGQVSPENAITRIRDLARG